MHKAVLSIPVVKHVLACIGVCNADKATLLSKLNQVGVKSSASLTCSKWFTHAMTLYQDELIHVRSACLYLY